MTKGFVYIVFGEAAYEQFKMSRTSVRRIYAGQVGITVITDLDAMRFTDAFVIPAKLPYREGKYDSCYFKTQLWKLTHYDQTIYLDCDTLLVNQVDDLFKVSGIALALDYFRDVANLLRNEPITLDWKHTFQMCNWYDEYYNSGVIAFSKNNLLHRFFEQWEKELLKTKQGDQHPFVRAVVATDITVQRLDESYNKFPWLIDHAPEARAKGLHVLHFVGELKADMKKIYDTL